MSTGESAESHGGYSGKFLIDDDDPSKFHRVHLICCFKILYKTCLLYRIILYPLYAMHFDGRKQAAKGLPSIAADVRRMTTHSISSIRALGLRTMCSTWASCAGELNSSITSTSLSESSTCTMAMRMAMAIPYGILYTLYTISSSGSRSSRSFARCSSRRTSWCAGARRPPCRCAPTCARSSCQISAWRST